MDNVAALMFAALLIESVVNIIQNLKDRDTSWKYWASLVTGISVGILVAWNWDLDLFSVIGMDPGRIYWIGPALTGLVLSRGSNIVSDLLSLVNRSVKPV